MQEIILGQDRSTVQKNWWGFNELFGINICKISICEKVYPIKVFSKGNMSPKSKLYLY